MRLTPDPEFQALVRKRYAGNPRAITALGLRLLVGRDSPLSPVDGAMLIEEAARQGDPDAWCRLAVLAATGIGRTQSWIDAFDALARAADLGDEHAARQTSLLRDLGVRDASEARAWWSAPGVSSESTTVLNRTPLFTMRAGLLPQTLCTHVIACAATRLAPAEVYAPGQEGLKLDPVRTNTHAPFSVAESDLVVQLIRARIACAAGVSPNTLEPLEVLHYHVGEHYRQHVDFFHPSLPDYAEEMRWGGQRIKTCLVYLNENYEGGETDFCELGFKVRGGTGDALIFENVLPDGTVAKKTVHAGQPPTRGEKWLLSQWIRDKPQPVM